RLDAHELALNQLLEPLLLTDSAPVGPEQRRQRARPEPAPEHARGAERAARLGIEGVESSLHHPQDRGRQLLLALGGRADQLLQVEGVAVGAVDEARDPLVARTRAEDVARELLAGLPGEA